MAPSLEQEPSLLERKSSTNNIIPSLQQNDNITSGNNNNTAATQKAPAGGGSSGGRSRHRRHRSRRNKQKNNNQNHPDDSKQEADNNFQRKQQQKAGEGSVVNMAEENTGSVQTEHSDPPPNNGNIPITLNPILDQAKEAPKDIRVWFESLSIDERVAALGFEDADLFSAVTKLVSTATTAQAGGGRPLSQKIPHSADDGATDRPKGM